MKLLLLCLGLTVVSAHKEGHHDVVTSNFDLSKISGNWYSILLASDKMEKIEENGSFRMFVEYFQALDSSTLLLKYQIKENGQCTEFSVVGEDTEQNGVYRVIYDGYNRFHIIEAVYDEYALLYTVNFDNKEKTQLVELYGREPDLGHEIKTRFGEICQEYGIPKENILDLTKVDRCLEARGKN